MCRKLKTVIASINKNSHYSNVKQASNSYSNKKRRSREEREESSRKIAGCSSDYRSKYINCKKYSNKTTTNNCEIQTTNLRNLYSDPSSKFAEEKLGDKLTNDLKKDSTQPKFINSYLKKGCCKNNSNEKENRYDKIARRGSIEAIKNSESASNINSVLMNNFVSPTVTSKFEETLNITDCFNSKTEPNELKSDMQYMCLQEKRNQRKIMKKYYEGQKSVERRNFL